MSLFQERLRHEPFWMLVACVLVNRTTWRAAEPVLAELRERWPTAAALYEAALCGRFDDVRVVVTPLGFGSQRSLRLCQLASAWCDSDRSIVTADDVMALPGCGRYAADSWAIFVEGRTDVEPTDRALKEHLSKKSS